MARGSILADAARRDGDRDVEPAMGQHVGHATCRAEIGGARTADRGERRPRLAEGSRLDHRRLPESAEEAVLAALREEDARAGREDRGDHPHLGHRALLRDDGQLVDAPGRARSARAGDRAGVAARRARGADRRAELHQGLVEASRAGEREHPSRRLPEELPGRTGVDRRVDPLDAGEDARDVAVDQRLGKIEREARDRAGGVGPDAVERAKRVGVRGELAAEALDDLARSQVERPRAPVVAEPAPHREHVVDARLGEAPRRRKSRHEALEIGDHRLDPGLLEHDLADPDGVRMARPTPRQIAGNAAEPGDERCGDATVSRGGRRSSPSGQPRHARSTSAIVFGMS